MSEVQVDGSCLPPIQEVCRDFAILEDGALAHCLQEQEIEQHYTSNVQKNQLVQKDLQMAKRLQDIEDKAIQQKQDEEHDLELAQGIQDKMQRKAEETTHWRKEQGQGAAKGSKEKETQGSRQQRQRRGNSRGTKDDGCAGRHLDWQMAELELQSERQLQQDEALAWKLQEEEQACLRAKKNRERNDDYRVAQVAQDEEIARYIQDQELKAQWAPPSKDPPAAGALGQRRSPQKAVQESFVAAPRISIQPLESSSVYPRGPQAVIRPQLCRNIAEDLDPTFRTRKLELPTKVTTSCSPAATQAHPVIVDGSFDYPGEGAESAFVSPSKRHPDKVGRRKPRDKREGCKQQ